MSNGGINGEGNFNHGNAITGPLADRVMPLFSMKGKTAIVTGAGAGIGLAVAQAFAEAGADVAIWYNSNNKAVERAAEIEHEYGVKCEHLPRTESVVYLTRNYRQSLQGQHNKV